VADVGSEVHRHVQRNSSRDEGLASKTTNGKPAQVCWQETGA